MLIESDPIIAEIYKSKFTEADFDVLEMKTIENALDFTENEECRLVLLDADCIKNESIELISKFKKNNENAHSTKIFVLSRNGRLENESELRSAGVDIFIDRIEIDPAKLVVEVKRLVNEFFEQKKNKERRKQGSSSRDKKILFIEDEEIFLEMFGKKLEDEGYIVEYAKNGAWGVRMATENDYDLIITDMVMPAMGGEEIIRKIKADDRLKDIPVIVLSASLIEEDIKPVREMGIKEDFYEKTKLIPSDLARRVNKILE